MSEVVTINVDRKASTGSQVRVIFGTGGLDCYQLSWKPKNIVKVSVLVIFCVLLGGNFLAAIFILF